MENEKKKVNYNKIPKKKPEPVEVIEPIAEPVAVETPKPVKKVIGTVNSVLNLREASNKSSKVLTVMPVGARVTIDGEENDFHKVKFNGLEGYAMKKFIDVQ